MTEKAINLPFEASEIKEIAIAEFSKRLDGLTPLHGGKEYAKFVLNFDIQITLWQGSEVSAPKETLAWGRLAGEKAVAFDSVPEKAELLGDKFTSGDPNTERQDRDMALTVEGANGNRRKVKVKK